MTHTEKVHVIFGLFVALTGVLALWSTYRPASPARFIWPCIAFILGLLLFIPVEAQTRTYQPVGWWDTVRSFVPDHPLHWFRDWSSYLNEWHVVQHKIGSFLILVATAVEFLRALGKLAHPRWGLVMPVLLLGIAWAFGVHGGNAEHLPNRVEQVHHWLFGSAFAVAAIALAFERTGHLRRAPWLGLWAVLVLAVGLDLTLFYRLTPAERALGAEHAHGAGMSPMSH